MRNRSSESKEIRTKKYGVVRHILQWLLRGLDFISPVGDSLRPLLHRLRGVKIGKRVWISLHVYIDSLYPRAIIIGDDCVIGLRTSIIAHLDDFIGPVIIEKGVFVGPHCVILPNVRIGENSVIRSGTVVSQNVPPNTLWGTPNAGPIAKVTVPLIRNVTPYRDFLSGLRPIPRKTKTNIQQGE
jgi:acetyltransferase-like isoleucine patch superfamily enzyme